MSHGGAGQRQRVYHTRHHIIIQMRGSAYAYGYPSAFYGAFDISSIASKIIILAHPVQIAMLLLGRYARARARFHTYVQGDPSPRGPWLG